MKISTFILIIVLLTIGIIFIATSIIFQQLIDAIEESPADQASRYGDFSLGSLNFYQAANLFSGIGAFVLIFFFIIKSFAFDSGSVEAPSLGVIFCFGVGIIALFFAIIFISNAVLLNRIKKDMNDNLGSSDPVLYPFSLTTVNVFYILNTVLSVIVTLGAAGLLAWGAFQVSPWGREAKAAKTISSSVNKTVNNSSVPSLSTTSTTSKTTTNPLFGSVLNTFSM